MNRTSLSVVSFILAIAAIVFGVNDSAESTARVTVPAEAADLVAEDPRVISLHELLEPTAALTPVGAQSAVLAQDPLVVAEADSDLDDEYFRLLAAGMEPNTMGWRVVLPSDYALLPSGFVFSSLDKFETPTGWAFLLIDGVVGQEYYPSGFLLNGGGPSAILPQAPVSFGRPFQSAVVPISVVPDGANGYAIQGQFTPRSVLVLKSIFGPKATSATAYVDWFGELKASGAPPNQRRIVLVADSVAYIPVDLDVLFAEADTLGGTVNVERILASGLTLSEATELVDRYD